MLEQELHEHLSHLSVEQQREVVTFARALAVSHIRGVPGQTLLQFAGTIAADDLALMQRAIDDDCAQVGEDERITIPSPS